MRGTQSARDRRATSAGQQRDSRSETDPSGPVRPGTALQQSIGNQAVQSGSRNGDREAADEDADVSTGVETGNRQPRSDSTIRRSVASDTPGRAAASAGSERTTAEVDERSGGLCKRCARRYRAGKPLDCQDCEAALQRMPASSVAGGAVGDAVLQPKLAVTSPNDAAEREAERVADAVMSMRDPTGERASDVEAPDGTAAGVDRSASGSRAESQRSRDKPGGRVATTRHTGGEGRGRDGERGPTARPSVSRSLSSTPSAGGRVDETVESRIESVRGGGRRLSDSERSFFEPRFGADLSDVRVHTGSTAARTASAIQARAYTVGQDIVFNRGEYRPGSPDGRRLLAHELTHVLQQRDGAETVSRQLGVEEYPDCTEGITGVENPEDRLEDARQEAIDMVDVAISSLQRALNGNAGNRVQAALGTHFQGPNQAQMRTAIGQYRGAKGRLELPRRIICNTAGSSVCKGNTLGYAWRNTGPYIHMCPAAVQDEDQTALTMVHEATHVAGGTRDHAYIWQNAYSNLSAAQAVNNADSYAFFADAAEIEITRYNQPEPDDEAGGPKIIEIN